MIILSSLFIDRCNIDKYYDDLIYALQEDIARAEDEIEKTVCAELDSFGTEDLLEDVADVLDTWVDHVLDDPLAAENNLNVPDGVALIINFSDSNTSIGNAFDFLLEQANYYLGGYDEVFCIECRRILFSIRQF